MYPQKTLAGVYPSQQIVNSIQSLCDTTTTGGTLTLTKDSENQQYLSGSMTQTIVLPVVSTLSLGHQFDIKNGSSDTITIQSSGTNTITTVNSGSAAVLTCVSLSGTGAGSWSYRDLYPSAPSAPGLGTPGTYQSIASDSLTISAGGNYVFPTLSVNTSNRYNTSNGRYTIPVTGWYSFTLITTTANSLPIRIIFRGRVSTVYNQDLVLEDSGTVAGRYSLSYTYIGFCEANQPFYWSCFSNAITGGRQDMIITSLF